MAYGVTFGVTFGAVAGGVAGVVVPGAGLLPFEGSALPLEPGASDGPGVPMLVLPGAVFEVPSAPGATVVVPPAVPGVVPSPVELGVVPGIVVGLTVVAAPPGLARPPVLPGSTGFADVLGVPIVLGVLIEPEDPIAPVLPGAPACATRRHPPNAGRPVATEVFATPASTAAGGTAAAP